MERLFLMFLDHTQRRTTVGRTPLELITRPEESYRLCCVVVCDLETSRICVPYIYDISSLRVKLRDPASTMYQLTAKCKDNVIRIFLFLEITVNFDSVDSSVSIVTTVRT